ncbi:uncharacterized protein LOC119658374 [Hermetia illucens]|uniref:uncharacterized protein LOC119658374 n=1 Tax=Hermetia illucens TaxID=343691 RepID=UPI0018CC52CD|nr:uncharacterized protein LOC119658374 [Hermetia illucens]
MSSSLIVVLFLFALSACFENVLSVDLTEKEGDLSYCQEFRTRADRNINFFNLDYFFNDKLENETFRYKLFIQGDRDIFIVLTETDSVQANSKLFEFGFNTGQPPAATFKTSLGGSQKVRTEENLHLSNKVAVPVVLVLKEDGELQLFVWGRSYPLLRFPDTSLNPKFISFTTRGSVLGQFYFNCADRPLGQADNSTAVGIPDEHAYPVVYISFRISKLARRNSQVEVKLHYNMTLHNPATLSDAKSGVKELMIQSAETDYQLPKLEIFSNNLLIDREDPSYILTVDLANRVRATASEEIKMECREVTTERLYCNLVFGLAEQNYHLTYFPGQSLVNPTIAQFADIKVFQAPNSFSTSDIPLRGDIIMEFKFDKTKF